MPSVVIAWITPSRSWLSARVPDSSDSVRHASSQQDAAPFSGSRTSSRDWWQTLNSSTKSANSSPSKIASRSNST